MYKKEKILIVEDSKTQAMLLENILLKEKYQVEVAENGIKALEYVNDSNKYPDVIVTDLNMPEMDGIQLCRLLKNTHPNIFIIVLTANEDNESLKESFDSGAVDFINKPINEIELFVRIKNVLRIKSAETELKLALKQLSENNKKLEQLSITDSLTGLFNRKYLVEKLIDQIAYTQRYGHPLSIVMIDLDHFKNVNDTYGHSAGDEALVKAAGIFKNGIRTSDTAGRYGGEEFLIITPSTSYVNCYALVEKILKQVKNLTFTFDNNYKLTFSAGITQLNNESIDELLLKVDQLMYKAKENGRDRIEFSI
jgi:two-component system, cell cycle response regulator